jgi:thiol-disulfide isomerase/thioredoxin
MNRDMLIGLLMVLLIPTMWASETFAKQPAVLEGEMTAPSPDFEFTTLSGERVTKEALKGKPTLLMFWATWCGICRDELPRIHELDTQARSMGLQIVAVAFSDDKNAVTKYVEQHTAHAHWRRHLGGQRLSSPHA